MSSETSATVENDSNISETKNSQESEVLSSQESAKYDPLTAVYEKLRHSEDSEELHKFARRVLPDRNNQAAFSRATALLEAVAGNSYTPEEDRIYLATTMPFPNILVKLSEDSSDAVRLAVAKNTNAKNWLVGRLTKDSCPEVRDAALCNPKASWKMRLEGAQCDGVGAKTLQYLASLGVSEEENAPVVLATMVRRAVALNPGVSQQTLQTLCNDKESDVYLAARSRFKRVAS